MNEDFIRQRITQLRMKKEVSEYRMSYDLGHSRVYINNISSGKSMPSVKELLAICEYFGLTPAEFFDEGNPYPIAVRQVLDDLARLDEEDLELVAGYVRRLRREPRA